MPNNGSNDGADPPARAILTSSQGEQKNEESSRDPSLLLLVSSAFAQPRTGQQRSPRYPAARQKNTIAAIEAMPADKFSYSLRRPDDIWHLVAHMSKRIISCAASRCVPAPKVER